MNPSLFLATILAALTLAACGKPRQALPENSTTYGTRTEEGTTLDQERSGEENDFVQEKKSKGAYYDSALPPDNPGPPAGTPGHEPSSHTNNM
jgi:hypothetical protein